LFALGFIRLVPAPLFSQLQTVLTLRRSATVLQRYSLIGYNVFTNTFVAFRFFTALCLCSTSCLALEGIQTVLAQTDVQRISKGPHYWLVVLRRDFVAFRTLTALCLSLSSFTCIYKLTQRRGATSFFNSFLPLAAVFKQTVCCLRRFPALLHWIPASPCHLGEEYQNVLAIL